MDIMQSYFVAKSIIITNIKVISPTHPINKNCRPSLNTTPHRPPATHDCQSQNPAFPSQNSAFSTTCYFWNILSLKTPPICPSSIWPEN